MKLKITHISDTHNKHNNIKDLPGGNLLIHSGDISAIGRKSEVKNFIKWFSKIDNYDTKIFIAGNHDLSFESEELSFAKQRHFDYADLPIGSNSKPEWLIELLNNMDKNIIYLENNSFNLNGIEIWGSPISAAFGYGWAFNVKRGADLFNAWEQIPKTARIVITHGPMFGYCDMNAGYENVGDRELLNALEFNIKPDLHFCGHIHEAYGYRLTDNGIYTFNSCICNLRYEPNNKPVSFEYDFDSKEISF